MSARGTEAEPVTASGVAYAASRYLTTAFGVALFLRRLRDDLNADDRDGMCVWAEEVAFLHQALDDANQDLHGLVQRYEASRPAPPPPASA